ncbi:MAG: hypothetical protein KIT56_01675 [Gammaproteobacteria bacterium]|nr:hypothetical protein [Gammaproteobacteria bacterium]MCW5582593.1 hypothetical protein [Gammaproteobacteria bacterium]
MSNSRAEGWFSYFLGNQVRRDTFSQVQPQPTSYTEDRTGIIIDPEQPEIMITDASKASTHGTLTLFFNQSQIKEEWIKAQASLLEKHNREIPSVFSTLASQITIGLVRDYIWGVVSYRNLDAFEGTLGTFAGPTLTQMGITVFPMLGTIKLTSSAFQGFFLDNKREWFKKQSVFTIASWTAIPAWNGAQMLGKWIGNEIGLSEESAGYFSGIFSGIAETIWQGAIVIPALFQQPIDVLEVALNSLGGAVWQWIFQANMPHNYDSNESNHSDSFVGLQIATGVAASTLLMTLLAWQINKCRARSQHPKQQTDRCSFQEEKASQSLYDSSYGTFFNTSRIGNDNSDQIEKILMLRSKMTPINKC